MRLLGAYPTRLTAYHLDELSKLVQDSYVLGEYEAGKLFDAAAAARLQKQGTDFSSLPVVSAGDRALAESINYPVSLLSARYDAMSRERDDFLKRMNGFLALVNKDAVLVDQLLAMAELEYWISRQPALSGSRKFYWTFAASHGLVADEVPLVDPLSPGVVQPGSVADLAKVDFMAAAVHGVPGMTLKSGIGVPFKTARFTPSGLTWTYTTAGEHEDLYGEDWAKLSLLESRPRITFGDCVVTQILPENVPHEQSWGNFFNITGSGGSSNLPVYIKIIFLPRRKQIVVDAADVNSPTLLGPKVSTDDVIVHDGTRAYDAAVPEAGLGGHYVFQVFPEFTKIRWLDADEALGGETVQDKQLSVFFTEYYPAYQCSIDERTWSQPIMLDPARMYPDGVTDMLPMDLDGTRFPIMDEAGNPLGFWLEMKQIPGAECMLRLESSRPRELTPGDFGAGATLEIEFDRPIYLNGLYVAPFVNFPVFVRSIKAEGMTTATSETLFSGNILLDRAQTIRFDRRLVRRLFLQLYQENYTVKEHLVDPEDKDKRDAFATLQTVLPFTVRRIDRAVPKKVFGFQYELGLRNIAGEDWVPQIDRAKKKPGIYTGGPYRTETIPEVVRLDAEYTGTVSFYLLYRKRMEDGTISDFVEQALTPGTAIAFSKEDMAGVQSADFYLKFVLKEEFAVVSKFLLQVSCV